MKRLRILVLAPYSNPESVSIPYVTFSHAAAVARIHDVTLVVGAPTEAQVRRANAPFCAIEVVKMPLLERVLAWTLRMVTRKGDRAGQMIAASSYPFFVAFEWRAWRMLRRRIFAGEFDVVWRVAPMENVVPSPFAFFLRKGPIPFVIGPLQGGLPWPSGFSQVKRAKEWISSVRKVSRYLPFARSTYRHAAAIIAGSSQTYSEYAAYREKVFFVPEPGVRPTQCVDEARCVRPGGKLELIFVGGLVARKACDLALRAAATLLRSHSAHFTIIGDGPERHRLEELARDLQIEEEVSFCGWLDHGEVFTRMSSSDVFLFPTLRDNGPAVVVEALASGAVPVVVDFGGPGDVVNSEVGYKVPLTNEGDVVAEIEKALTELAGNRELLERLRRQGMAYARRRLTWDAKAQDTTKVLSWVLGRGPKPHLPPARAVVGNFQWR